HHIREGKHGARSTKQAIAIGLSKALRAGVYLPPPKKGRVSEQTRRSAARAYAEGRCGNNETAKQAKPSQSKRAPKHDTGREPRDRLQPDKLREQKADEDVL